MCILFFNSLHIVLFKKILKFQLIASLGRQKKAHFFLMLSFLLGNESVDIIRYAHFKVPF